MLNFIAIPVITGICVYGFYKIIELFVRKKERVMIIEKIASLENVNPEKLNFPKLFSDGKVDRSGFFSLRAGSLLVGVGLGLLLGYIIALNTNFPGVSPGAGHYSQLSEIIYGSTTLLFGGLGLITGFIIEHKMKK